MVTRGALPQEPELVPFVAGQLPGRRWLCLAAHPDDETFGPGATLAMARDRGVEVHLAVVTDGRVQGEPALRSRELAAAAAALGLSGYEEWAFEDRTLAPDDHGLQGRVLQTLVRQVPDLVLSPAPVDLNIDHRALALALQRVLRRLTLWGLLSRPPRWVASYEVAAVLLPNLLVAADAGWARKRQAATAHAGQQAHRPYFEVMEALGTLRSLTLKGCDRAEAFHLLQATEVARLTAATWAGAMGAATTVRRGRGPSRSRVVSHPRDT